MVMPEACSGKCPLYDAETLSRHSILAVDDPELLVALRSFAAWFYEAGQNIEDELRFAARLYTRDDHDGTCIPKTILFAHYKSIQFDSYGPHLRLSDAARAAVRGEAVGSWPDGEIASGTTWNQMFAMYSLRYERGGW